MEFFGVDLIELIKAVGVLGVAAIVFTESGLLVGFFLPGDSLLFTAGFLASQGYLPIVPLVLLCFIAAVLGDNVGYAIGKRIGPRLFVREESFFFHKNNVEKTRAYFERYGPKTIVIARFIPVIRTFAPLMAGVGTMHYRIFFLYNLAGGLLWSVCVPILGYALGATIPDVDHYLLPIILGIIFISFIPPAREYWRSRSKKETYD